MRLLLLLLASLLLQAVPRPYGSPGGKAPGIPTEKGFILLAFPEPLGEARGLLPAPRPLLLPFRTWLLDRELHLITSVHRDFDKARRDALREGLGTLLVPSYRISGAAGRRRLFLQLEAFESASGSRVATAEESLPLPKTASSASLSERLPEAVGRLYEKLLAP